MKAIQIPRHEADLFISMHHRHHKPAQGDMFRIAAVEEQDGMVTRLIGVAQVGRPVARGYVGKSICEVTRLCTDGTRNACSFLYAAVARKAKRMGFSKIITYILIDEPGTSLRAAGWTHEANTKGGKWNCQSRPRATKAPTCVKQRWVKEL